jgi:hypothetical protein
MQQITMLEWYRLAREDKAPKEGSVEVVSGTDEEYATYKEERERDRRDFEARMAERTKIKDVLCANCGHECGNHTLFQECRQRAANGQLFCNCPDFVPSK